MEYGRLNIVAGGIAIILGTFGGFALGFTLDPFFEKGFYEIPLWRLLLRAGHTHGMPFAFFNIVIGLAVGKLALSDAWKKRCSICAALSLIMPIGLILRGMTNGAMTFVPVVMIGTVFFLAATIIMIKGAMVKEA